MPELAVIVPTRGRPENIRRLIGAWDFTNAWDVADLVLAVDADDPEIRRYHDLAAEHRHPDTDEDLFRVIEYTTWLPMVAKLNATAKRLAEEGSYFALAFAGDDHVPETIGWAARYLTVLHELGSGMVYGDDGYQGRKLSTEWAITADVVRALGGRMVPAPVDHMYCDNSIMDLFDGAGAIRHLPEVRIEHRHPIAGKAETDAQYQRVNHRDQFRTDRLAYERWRSSGMISDIRTVRALRAPDAPSFRLEKERPVARPVTTRRKAADRMRSGPTRRRIDVSRYPFSYELKEVRGATPDEVGMALADMASMVPADQEIVELGVFQGRTALIMAWGATQGSGAHVTGIDPWDLEGNVYDPPFTDAESRIWAEYRVRELGYGERVQLVQAFSADVAETWTGAPVGLLFVDGDHTKEGARRDIEAWAPHLAPGATIAVDDYHHPDWPGVAEAVDELVAEGFLAPVEVFHDRLAVTRLTEGDGRVTVVTSEGVTPSPYPAAPGQVADEPPTVAPHVEATVVRETEEVHLPEADNEVSGEDWAWKVAPEEAVALTVPVGPVADLNTVQLRALAKHRGIVLGVRKDKRDLILQALRDGR